MLRIALIAPFALHPKGTTRWRVLPLARALVAAGHAVRVVIPPYDWPAHSGRRWRMAPLSPNSGGMDGVDVVNVSLGQAPAVLARLLSWTLAWRPDVIHCFKPVGYSGLAAWLLARLPAAAPALVDADDWEAGWLARSGRPHLVRRLAAWQEQQSLRSAAAVTAASGWLRDWAATLRRGQQNLFYLPNGVERSQALTRHNLTPNRQILLLYSRFVEHSPAQVWAIWQAVLAQQPAARLWLAGEGLQGDAPAAALSRLASRHGVGESLRFLGWLPAAARLGLFAAVDAALLPVNDTPLNRAKSPMRLVDLLAAGVPVATQAVGEYGVYVRDGENGLLARAGDDCGLARAALCLLEDGQLRARLGAAAARRMGDLYAWPLLAETALAAYESARA